MAERGSSSSGSENGDSRNSSVSSASEEERLRRLFNSCDGDGDGYLDGEDLTFMCSMLNMSDSVGEVRHQLGWTESSKISFDDFLRCRTRVMLESTLQHPQLVFHNLPSSPSPAMMSGEDTGIESDASGRIGSIPANKLTSWPTLSSDSLGALSYTRPESADYDSGARDLSPEPTTLTLTQMMETHDPYSFNQLREAGADSLLDIANRLHAAALTSLKGEIFELKNHIKKLAAERTVMEGSYTHRLIQSDTKLGCTDFEERLEELTSRYEERIIELHSVIAELRKKLERHQINVIREEDEEEDSDMSQSVHSVDGESCKDENNEISREFNHVVSEIQTAMAQKSLPTIQDSDAVMASSCPGDSTEQTKENKSLPEEESPPKLPPRTMRPSTLVKAADPALKSELSALRTDNEELRRQTSSLEVELGNMSEQMETCMREKEILIKKIIELEQKLSALTSSSSHGRMVGQAKQPSSTPPPLVDRRSVEPDVYPVAKMAELKKLKTCASDVQVLGSEVTTLGVQSTKTAEHLVQSLNDGSSVAEMLKTMSRVGGPNVDEAVVKEFEVELERRQAKVDHLKAQNDVLSATLEESRSQSERLSVLMGKYESNNTALQLAAVFSDSCIEAQDVLTALLDTEIGVLLANCRAAGLGGLDNDDDQEVTAILQRAHHARRRAEGVARHLLARLDRNNGSHSATSSCHPWEDVSTNSRTASTSSTNSSSDADFTKADEVKLRDHIQQLKSDRAAVRITVLELESIHVDPVTSEPRRRIEAQRLDLENAVLVQELMAVKEEKAELKAKSYLLEKEKRALELRLSGKETQEQALRVQIDFLKGELSYRQDGHDPSITPAPSDLCHVAELKSQEPCKVIQELTLSLDRERTLKKRISDLMLTLEKISRNSESRHKQSAEFVNDLKRANTALIAAFDKAKKKYQGRLKKMESQLKSVCDKYESEVASLKHRLIVMETHCSRPNETSL